MGDRFAKTQMSICTYRSMAGIAAHSLYLRTYLAKLALCIDIDSFLLEACVEGPDFICAATKATQTSGIGVSH